MKLKQWLFGAAALAMLGACSDNLADGPKDPSDGRFETTEGEGYIGINLQLPQQPSTRAYDGNSNDVFDDGLASEYSIKNAALLLFWGPETTEGDAEFIGAYTIKADELFDQPNGDHITTSFQNVATLNKKIEAAQNMQLWGMAIVNYDTNVFKLETNVQNENYGNLTVLAKTKTTNAEGKEVLGAASEVIVTVKKEESTDEEGNTIAAVSGMKFKDFRLLITDQALCDDANKIFMTNAPLSNKVGETTSPAGSDFRIQTLAKLDVNKIYDSESQAKLNPAGCVFVERAVAKITLSKFPLTTTFKYQNLTISDNGTVMPGTVSDVTMTVKELGWLVDNEQSDSYIVRNAVTTNTFWPLTTITSNGTDAYRFVGGVKMDIPTGANGTIQENHNWYRTYWCVDPDYSNDKVYNTQASLTSTYNNLLKTVNGELALDTDAAVLYPRENTFSVANQNYKNTTRVVFRVRYEWLESGAPITVYCKAGDPSVIYKENEAQILLQSPFISSNTIHDFVLQNVDPIEAEKYGIAEKSVVGEQTTWKIKYGLNDFNFTYNTIQGTGTYHGKVYQIASATLRNDSPLYKSLKAGVTQQVITNAISAALSDANESIEIRSFADETAGTSGSPNVCFYATNIKHFGDYYCPMPEDAAGNPLYSGITTDKVYESNNAAKYLGRWGMVRNNWYDLSINTIKNMGYADVPNGNVTMSDDNNEEKYYISAKVHVLSWAKRTQGVDF